MSDEMCRDQKAHPVTCCRVHWIWTSASEGMSKWRYVADFSVDGVQYRFNAMKHTFQRPMFEFLQEEDEENTSGAWHSYETRDFEHYRTAGFSNLKWEPDLRF